ncbi:MAG: cupin-like domain-containing protein [Asticcacaulis sp.]|uniref:cupin-like domain-containing protein n=1 Tax=Asticcacaulis sp. TaxID=1872648 RepID=UPI0039E6E9EB
MTPEVFARQILPAGEPVIMRGLVTHWPAVRRGMDGVDSTVQYLKAMDTGQPTTVLEANNATQGRFAYGADMHDFNFNKRFKTISAGLDQILAALDHPNPPYTYIQSTVIRDYLPRFLADNPCPILPPAVQPRIWISNATRAQTHNDNDHNIACVVAGRRRFTLFPPEQLKNLYIGPMDHTPSGRAISLASLEEPDFDRFPKFAEALKHAQVAEMEPGDALYVPKYWWHHVQSLEAFNVLVNYWWGNSAQTAENPMAPFLAALLALKDLSPSDKLYWKTMFDHYIFQTDGDPMAHIPPAHQGGLGRQTTQMRREIFDSLRRLIEGRG